MNEKFYNVRDFREFFKARVLVTIYANALALFFIDVMGWKYLHFMLIFVPVNFFVNYTLTKYSLNYGLEIFPWIVVAVDYTIYMGWVAINFLKDIVRFRIRNYSYDAFEDNMKPRERK